MITRLAQLITIIFMCHLAASSQTAGKQLSGALIDPTKPPVFIEFVRSGKCKKDNSIFNYGNLCDARSETTRTFDAVWLRLVNNTKWSIGLTVSQAATEKNASPVVIPSTSFVDDDGESKAIGTMVANKGAEMDVVYKSEVETGCDFHKEAPKGQSCFRIQATAPEIPLPGISSSVFIAPGQSIVFPIDLQHVQEYVNLYVLYNFSWEYSGKHFAHFPHYDSQHRAYFGWFDLEKGLRAESEKKRAA